MAGLDQCLIVGLVNERVALSARKRYAGNPSPGSAGDDLWCFVSFHGVISLSNRCPYRATHVGSSGLDGMGVVSAAIGRECRLCGLWIY